MKIISYFVFYIVNMEECTISNKDFNNIIHELSNNNEQNNNYIGMDINEIMNILSDKMNNIKIINNELIKELCIGIILHCKKHNKMINEWFDEQYFESLKAFKQNNEDYLMMSNDYKIKSFVFIENK